MKTFQTRMLFIAFLSLSLAIIGGCGEKSVEPYTPEAGENMPEGKSLDSTGARSPGTITEENMGPSEDTLDAGSGKGEAVGGFGDQNSDEYKKKYGRSSPQMQPIYFNFDQATIREDQIPRMEQNGQYLKDNPAGSIVIEGNCDEQGTNEYNLALGERRAINAKNYLISLGVEESRIRTTSYGEERPLFTGLDEFDYSQNRRDDFILE
jgi:peptidoglycan-associated lipoprotein